MCIEDFQGLNRNLCLCCVFQTYASYYKGYVDHLVSYGYVVIQYDTKKMVLLSDKIEVISTMSE